MNRIKDIAANPSITWLNRPAGENDHVSTPIDHVFTSNGGQREGLYNQMFSTVTKTPYNQPEPQAAPLTVAKIKGAFAQHQLKEIGSPTSAALTVDTLNNGWPKPSNVEGVYQNLLAIFQRGKKTGDFSYTIESGATFLNGVSANVVEKTRIGLNPQVLHQLLNDSAAFEDYLHRICFLTGRSAFDIAGGISVEALMMIPGLVESINGSYFDHCSRDEIVSLLQAAMFNAVFMPQALYGLIQMRNPNILIPAKQQEAQLGVASRTLVAANQKKLR